MSHSPFTGLPAMWWTYLWPQMLRGVSALAWTFPLATDPSEVHPFRHLLCHGLIHGHRHFEVVWNDLSTDTDILQGVPAVAWTSLWL